MFRCHYQGSDRTRKKTAVIIRVPIRFGYPSLCLTGDGWDNRVEEMIDICVFLPSLGNHRLYLALLLFLKI